jgi:prepilin-type N-terminal cleavage/methylation domain-containing protein
MKLPEKTKGLTLVEILVSIVIIGIVMGMVYLTLESNWRGADRAIIAADIQFDARRAMDMIIRDIRQSDDITALAPNTLTLTIGAIAVTYNVNADNELIRTQGGVPAVLCSNIDPATVMFAFQGARGIDIHINILQAERVSTGAGARHVVSELRSTVQRRNI